MKKISAQIVADSVNSQGNRITTFLLTYPRFIHGELMTHRMFSRNSASSRAIPFKKMVKMVEEDPFIPIAWQKDHKGMQGTEYITGDWITLNNCKQSWLASLESSISWARTLNEELDVTKQLCNRLFEPFMWHTVLVTATEWENFFKLRCPQYIFGKGTNKPKIWKSKKDAIKDFPDWETHNDLFWRTMNYSQAEIHIQALAESMWDAMNESIPNQLESGQWHIPFGDRMDDFQLQTYLYNLQSSDDNVNFSEIVVEDELKIEIATARCARLSYMTFDGEIDYEKDIKLHDQLIGPPFHASPFEHCARAMHNQEYKEFIKGKVYRELENHDYIEIPENTEGWCNNFRGFIPYRYLIENEN